MDLRLALALSLVVTGCASGASPSLDPEMPQDEQWESGEGSVTPTGSRDVPRDREPYVTPQDTEYGTGQAEQTPGGSRQPSEPLEECQRYPLPGEEDRPGRETCPEETAGGEATTGEGRE
ncbi:MAG: hypothetical protein ACFCGT_25190 [Sandaracinaceae bacterium]